MLPLRTLLTLGSLITSSLAVQTVVVKGSEFVNSVTNARFQIIGVDYQPGGQSGYEAGKVDPLSDGDICLRDAALMQRLGVNTIRVYNLDPSLDHDKCASIFNSAGIYMILDVNSPLQGESLNRVEPWTTYTKSYLNRVFAVIENFKAYPNTLAFFAGNEVINEDSTWLTPAYIRAVQRDMKQYIAKNCDRSIPVGYSAADVRSVLVDTWEYMSCDLANSTESRSDFFGLNSYSWCGQSSYETSGYNVLVEDFSNTSVPIFFSEYGCNKVTPRVFTEVQALYGDKMTEVMSGGLVYEFTQEDSNYGLVTVNSNNTVSLLTDFDNLQKQYAKLDISKIESQNSSQASVKAPTCASSLIGSKDFLNTFNLPDAPDGVSDLIKNGIANANNGKIVDITTTKVSSTVYNSDGSVLNNLSLNKLSNDQSNVPSNTTSGSSSSTSSASGSASSTGAASSINVQKSGAMGLFGVLAAMMMLA